MNDASWRENAIRLIFLIADAPPHLDYPQDEDYAADMVRAREKGIKIFSVASSGLDDQGEYIFRQIAQQTMGNFLFILYQSAPQGELDTPHSVEQFTVNNPGRADCPAHRDRTDRDRGRGTARNEDEINPHRQSQNTSFDPNNHLHEADGQPGPW